MVVGKGKLSSSTNLKSDLTEGDSVSHSTRPNDQGSVAGVPLPKHVQAQTLSQQVTDLTLAPSSLGAASSSHPSGSADNKPLPSSSPLTLQPIVQSDDTLSETMDEEFVVDDREVDQPTSTPVKAKDVHTIQANKGSSDLLILAHGA